MNILMEVTLHNIALTTYKRSEHAKETILQQWTHLETTTLLQQITNYIKLQFHSHRHVFLVIWHYSSSSFSNQPLAILFCMDHNVYFVDDMDIHDLLHHAQTYFLRILWF